jgi:hypothetical protein
MDVFKTGHQFGDFDFQLNDHNPGVSSNGLFWTMPIPDAAASLDLAEGKAAFCLTQALMPDLHDLLTSLWGGGAVDGEGNPLGSVFSSTVSAQAQWFDAGSITETLDSVNRFRYINAQTMASIKWKSVRRGVMFESDDGPQKVLFAAIGEERNGVFF